MSTDGIMADVAIRVKLDDNRGRMIDLGSKITFITSSLGTKWESYSQALLRIGFPECDRVVIDGTNNWHPLFFVEEAKRISTEYVVLVDEDCFVFDRAQVLTCLEMLDRDASTAVLATPDGGTFHRDYNPIACNPFFALIRRSALLTSTRDDSWKTLTYKDIAPACNADHVPGLDQLRMSYTRSERYYPFFWAILRSGFKIRYLIPDLNSELLASELRCQGATAAMAIHMWWLRSWNVRDIEPYLKVSNQSRYRLVETAYLAPRFVAPSSRNVLAVMNARRIWRKGICRARRLLRPK